MSARSRILDEFKLFSAPTGGIVSWLTEDSPSEVFDRLDRLDEEPLSQVQLTQLLVLAHEAGFSSDFFRYYWLCVPDHPCDVTRIPSYDPRWLDSSCVQSLAHLKWGMYRLYVDGLLFFGNVRTAYRAIRAFSLQDLEGFFNQHRFDSEAICQRGPALPLASIPKDDRYLISEMACKSYEARPGSAPELRAALEAAYNDHVSRGGGRVTTRQLLDGSYVKITYSDRHQQLLFSADEFLDEEIDSGADLAHKFSRVEHSFERAREAALRNTALYLSMVNDLDVYVATSMRTRSDFRAMANFCEQVFLDGRLADLNVRYFDPTLSAADGHEDKGLIECLMVKCAKVLVYCAGERESYGKDAEAAMALSLGKPVIFYCDQEQKGAFYRDVHPLSRLIDFNSGVAVGAMVTDQVDEVTELLRRILFNKLEYRLEQPKPGYFRLRETLTDSVVRLQTNDQLLTETFWNYYQNLGQGAKS